MDYKLIHKRPRVFLKGLIGLYYKWPKQCKIKRLLEVAIYITSYTTELLWSSDCRIPFIYPFSMALSVIMIPCLIHLYMLSLQEKKLISLLYKLLNGDKPHEKKWTRRNSGVSGSNLDDEILHFKYRVGWDYLALLKWIFHMWRKMNCGQRAYWNRFYFPKMTSNVSPIIYFSAIWSCYSFIKKSPVSLHLNWNFT